MARDHVAQLRLRVVPALTLLEAAHEVCGLWRALERGEPLPDPVSRTTFVAVWRADERVFHAALADTEARALRQAINGEPVGVVCEVFGSVEASFAALASWFKEGWVAAVT